MSRIALLSLFVFVWAVGCSSPARNRGRTPVKDLDRRDPSEHGLARVWIQIIADRLAQRVLLVAGRVDLRQRGDDDFARREARDESNADLPCWANMSQRPEIDCYPIFSLNGLLSEFFKK